MHRPVVLFAALILPAQALAATHTFDCTLPAFDAGGLPAGTHPLMLTFDGDASGGTLAVKSPWGDMSFANVRLAGDPAGDFGVRASGPATILMPDKAAMEACLADRGKGEEKTDADLLALFIQGCATRVAEGPAPVAASVTFEISVIDGAPNIFFTRRYVDKSPVAGDTIEVASFPLPTCALAK